MTAIGQVAVPPEVATDGEPSRQALSPASPRPRRPRPHPRKRPDTDRGSPLAYGAMNSAADLIRDSRRMA